MITRACRWAKLEFGLGYIKNGELSTLKNVSKEDFQKAIIAIKENNPAGYYRNLEYRLGQTIKKEKDETKKENLKLIYRQLIRYNWNREDPRPSDASQQGAPSASDGLSGPADSAELPGSSGSPEPSTSNADDQRTDKRKVKKESIRTLTKAERAKFDAFDKKNKIKFNNLNIAKLNMNGTLPRYYIKSDDGILRHVGRDPISQRTPLDLTFPDEEETEGCPEGTYKVLTNYDQHYVKLKAKTEKFNTSSSNNFNKLSIEKLRKYPSVCHSCFISEEEMIASNGGADLWNLINQNEKFELFQFKQFAKDIYGMQSEKLYMTDMKLENLVCANEKEMIKLIDIDSIHEGRPNSILNFTAAYITDGLHDDYENTESALSLNNDPKLTKRLEKEYQQALSNIVTYALLKCMIEATNGEIFPLNINKAQFEVTSFPIGEERINDATQQRSFNETRRWIDTNVKPQYREDMHLFSRNPELHDGMIDLSEVLIFHRSALRFSGPSSRFDISI